MKKLIIKILFSITLLFIPLFTFATNIDNIKIVTEDTGNNKNNTYLDQLSSKGNFFSVSTTGEKGAKYLLLNIARDMRVMVFAVIFLMIIVMVLKLLFSESTDEEQQKKLRKGILWASIGIMIMQISFVFYNVMFDKDVNAALAKNTGKKLIEPFAELLMLLASFAFIVMAIYAFYRIITAGGEEDKIKKGKTAIYHAIIGFIIIKFSNLIVTNTFNPDCNGGSLISYWGTNICENVKDNSKIVITLINWFNTFVGIIVVLMIIYAGFLVITGGGDDEKTKKAKKIIFNSAIGLLILFASYLILTFFIIPESKI
ncbi:MAG: hypothetical protein PHE25_00025 [Candidatus Gracilibacteria bacterium]|nr:hypothetical protein [Candidatus Gracilibacteria bacterium]